MQFQRGYLILYIYFFFNIYIYFNFFPNAPQRFQPPALLLGALRGAEKPAARPPVPAGSSAVCAEMRGDARRFGRTRRSGGSPGELGGGVEVAVVTGGARYLRGSRRGLRCRGGEAAAGRVWAVDEVAFQKNIIFCSPSAFSFWVSPPPLFFSFLI